MSPEIMASDYGYFPITLKRVILFIGIVVIVLAITFQFGIDRDKIQAFAEPTSLKVVGNVNNTVPIPVNGYKNVTIVNNCTNVIRQIYYNPSDGIVVWGHMYDINPGETVTLLVKNNSKKVSVIEFSTYKTGSIHTEVLFSALKTLLVVIILIVVGVFIVTHQHELDHMFFRQGWS